MRPRGGEQIVPVTTRLSDEAVNRPVSGFASPKSRFRRRSLQRGVGTLPTMAFEVDRSIAVSPEVAFDAMADARGEVRWNSKVTRSDLVSGEPIAQGSRFQTVNRGQQYDATITEYERPGRLVFVVTGKQLDITTTFTFAADGRGTLLHGDFDFRPKGFFRVVFPMMAPMIRRDLPKQMGAFAEFCTR